MTISVKSVVGGVAVVGTSSYTLTIVYLLAMVAITT